jgi:hypothetical protein
VFQHRNFLLAIEIYRRRIVVTNFENKKDGLTIAPSLNPKVDITLLQNIALELGIAITKFQTNRFGCIQYVNSQEFFSGRCLDQEGNNLNISDWLS